MQKTPYVFPIIGGRKVEHLEDNIEGLNVALSEEHIKYLESVLSFDVGWPHNFVVRNTAPPTRQDAHMFANRVMVRTTSSSRIPLPTSRSGPANRRFVLPSERGGYRVRWWCNFRLQFIHGIDVIVC